MLVWQPTCQPSLAYCPDATLIIVQTGTQHDEHVQLRPPTTAHLHSCLVVGTGPREDVRSHTTRYHLMRPCGQWHGLPTPLIDSTNSSPNCTWRATSLVFIVQAPLIAVCSHTPPTTSQLGRPLLLPPLSATTQLATSRRPLRPLPPLPPPTAAASRASGLGLDQ